MSQFFTLPTKIGQGLLSNAIAYREPLAITEMAIGDGGGTLPTPDASVTKLINEVRRAPINQISTDPDNPNWVIVEQVLPPDVGGWTIREVGVFDADGNLIAYGNYPETYKPQLAEGSSRTQTIRFIMELTDTGAVTLKIDPAVVMASREYVDDSIEAHEQSRNHPYADTVNQGMVKFATLTAARAGTDSKTALTPAGGSAQVEAAMSEHEKSRNHPTGTESAPGMLQLASVDETKAGTNGTKATHSAGVKAVLDEHCNEWGAHKADKVALAAELSNFDGASTVQAVLYMLGAAAKASNHNAIPGRDTSNAHPASAVSTSGITGFSDAQTVQDALEKIGARFTAMYSPDTGANEGVPSEFRIDNTQQGSTTTLTARDDEALTVEYNGKALLKATLGGGLLYFPVDGSAGSLGSGVYHDNNGANRVVINASTATVGSATANGTWVDFTPLTTSLWLTKGTYLVQVKTSLRWDSKVGDGDFGIRLIVDGYQKDVSMMDGIEGMTGAQVVSASAIVTLGEGNHSIKMQYKGEGGGAVGINNMADNGTGNSSGTLTTLQMVRL